MTEIGDCRPICTRCGAPIEIKNVREDGWIDLEPHRCKPQLRIVVDTDDAPCTQCNGTGWDNMRERECDCVADSASEKAG